VQLALIMTALVHSECLHTQSALPCLYQLLLPYTQGFIVVMSCRQIIADKYKISLTKPLKKHQNNVHSTEGIFPFVSGKAIANTEGQMYVHLRMQR